MKILWLSHNVPYPPVGGVLQRNYHLVRGIATRAELHLVALRQRALCRDDEALDMARDELSRFCETIHVFDIDWETSSVTGRAGLTARMIRGPEPYDVFRYHSRDMMDFLSSGGVPRPDLIHVDTLGLIPYLRAAPAAPAVLNHHNHESDMLAARARGERHPVRRAVFAWQARRTRRFEREHGASFGSNLVVSEKDRDRLREIVPEARTAVIPNGTDTSFFSAPSNGEPDNCRIVMVGSHSWYPNRDAALFFLDEIWPAIIAREPRATWYVVGRNPNARVMEAASRDHRIKVLGFVDDLREVVAEAAVFACPFRKGGGTRLKVLDALAMRKALVSTSLGAEGVPLEAGRHCLLADAPESFADSVVELFRNPQRRVELGEAGRLLVEEKFGWESIASTLFTEYERVVKTPGVVEFASAV